MERFMSTRCGKRDRQIIDAEAQGTVSVILNFQIYRPFNLLNSVKPFTGEEYVDRTACLGRYTNTGRHHTLPPAWGGHKYW